MLPAPHRLRTPEQFRVALRGRCGDLRLPAARAGGDLMVVHAVRRPGREQQPTRIGLVVSKAVGNAVVRNGVARRLRHQLSARLGADSALPVHGVDVVVRAQPVAATADSAQLGAELDRLLARIDRRLAPRAEAAVGRDRS